jgi:tetratricopeptide (TPR) repeat protein
VGEEVKAIRVFEQALAISHHNGDRLSEETWLNNLGNTYKHAGDYEKAFYAFKRALGIAQHIGDRKGEGNALGNIGNLYAENGGIEEAYPYYEQALAIAREIGDRLGEANALGALAGIYKHFGHIQKAIESHEQSLAIDRAIDNRLGIGISFLKLGIIYEELGELSKAMDYARDSLQAFVSIDSRHTALAREYMAHLETKKQAQPESLPEPFPRMIEAVTSACLGSPQALQEFEALVSEMSQDGSRKQFLKSLRQIVYSGSRFSRRLVELLESKEEVRAIKEILKNLENARR